MALRNPGCQGHTHQHMRGRKEERRPRLGWGLWQWAALTWAHPGCQHIGPHADTGSDPGSRSPPAAHRLFLGEEGARGRRRQAPWSPCRHWHACRIGDVLDPPAMLTCVLQGAPTCVIPHAIHTDTSIDTGVLHTVICVHPTGGPFKAGGTGAPVVRGRG